MINFRMLKLSDPWLWSAAGGLVLVGLFAIFSCTYSMQIKLGGDALLYVKRQLSSILIGGVGLAIFTYLDYQHLKRAAPYFYGIMIFMLAVVLFGGISSQGAQRWFQFGPFSFQPSELSKIFLVISLALFLSKRVKLKGLWDPIFLLAMVGAPFLLIFKQPDLGTALVFFFILLGMLTSAWSSPKLLILLVTPLLSILFRPVIYLWVAYLLVLVLVLFLSRASLWDWILVLGVNIAVGVAVPFIWGMLKAYQQKRILAFLNPGLDPYGAGYHSLQSKIAIGSGGLFGKGFLHGTQTQLQFIPEQYSDFIFSVIGEEFGFIGSAAVVALLLIIVWRAFTIAVEAADLFGYMLASGVAVMASFHVIANIGMTLGLLPVVGIPLPFVSFGGTALLMNMISLGILQSVCMRRQKLIF
ncbi:MAG: rod shape-determining protein RodA [Candidatus Margulisbacteria bacterium]|nr:rod shape-determining protein RodA [Candidatus Margulisiibacteriota bacterium]